MARAVVNLARRLHDKSNGSAPTNQFADGAPGYCFTVADPKSEAHVDRIDSMGVVAKRNFSGAARELHLSQAMVSKQVRALEDWLGAQLLHRTKLHRLCRKTIN